ncbi:MAG: hypothetical protein WB555_06415, partial [Candidatus Korobacteraceae bacterium]
MKLTAETQSYGATLNGEVAEFRVWAPFQRNLSLRLMRAGSTTEDIPMQPDGEDFVAAVPASAGDCYWYVLDDGLTVPDPVSRLLPDD